VWRGVKEWRMTVGDYVREIRDGMKGVLRTVVILIIVLCVPLAAPLFKTPFDAYDEAHDRAVSFITEQKYEEAAAEFTRMRDIKSELQEGFSLWNLFIVPHFPDYSRDLTGLLDEMLRRNEFSRGYDILTGELSWVSDGEKERFILSYAGNLYAKGKYREATEIYLVLLETTGNSGNLLKTARLYAEELRAAGDEAGAEAWLEYVEERRRDAE